MQWKGYEWIKRGDGLGGPGPNHWRDSNVMVDDSGNLILTIKKLGDIFTCGQIMTKEFLGYGGYMFVITSPLKWDKNIVAGAFTYLDDENELDIEYSYWSTRSTNAGFTVQPSPYTDDNHQSFNVPEDLMNTRHTISHYPDGRITFTVQAPDGKLIKSWSYAGDKIPAKNQQFMFNLWLVDGKQPSDGKDAEMIISDFTFTPMP